MPEKKNIKDFKSSRLTKFKAFFLENRRNALAFLLCLFLSFLAWMSIMQNKTYELWITYPLQYKNAPPDLDLYADLPKGLNIRVKDKGKTVFQYQRRNFKPAIVDFKNKDAVTLNGNSYTLSFSNVFETYIKGTFAQSTAVMDYFPKDMDFDVVQISSKRLPVTLLSDISCKKQFHLSDSATITPDSITLYGRSNILDTISSIKTHLLRAYNINDTLDTDLGLHLPASTKAVPERVSVNIPVEAYTEGSQIVPVTIKNVPKKLRVRTFPDDVRIKYLVGISKYKEVRPEDFKVFIDYNDIIQSSSNEEFLNLETRPSFVNNCKIDPQSVEWMIEVIED